MSWKAGEFTPRLKAACDAFDRATASRLVDELVEHLRGRDDHYPAVLAKEVLDTLRRKRYFDLLQRTADELIQGGQRAPVVRRQYAQSLIDQRNLTAAITVLERLVEDTGQGRAREDAGENAEARGLLGRAYKQLYVEAAGPARRRNGRHLERAINYYRSVYRQDLSLTWQGINAVALLQRASDDEVELDQIADPGRLARSIASEVLGTIESRDRDQEVETWDLATAFEACVALDEHDKALEWLARYLGREDADAFELASTHRQLVEVWRLTPEKAPGDALLPPLRARLLEAEGGEVTLDVAELSVAGGEKLGRDGHFEKVLGVESFRTMRWFRLCLERASAVVKVETPTEDPVGTGFVVRGGDFDPDLGEEPLILTNSHVVSDGGRFANSIAPERARLNFETEASEPVGVGKIVSSSAPGELDYSLLRPAAELPGKIRPVPLAGALPILAADPESTKVRHQRAYIIGHPSGRKLSFSIHDNRLLDYDERRLHYRSPTEPGSSGSPVFNEEWELIALHHAGSREMPRLNEKPGTYAANEGIPIRAILEDV